jgi:hypothetical protein
MAEHGGTGRAQRGDGDGGTGAAALPEQRCAVDAVVGMWPTPVTSGS